MNRMFFISALEMAHEVGVPFQPLRHLRVFFQPLSRKGNFDPMFTLAEVESRRALATMRLSELVDELVQTRLETHPVTNNPIATLEPLRLYAEMIRTEIDDRAAARPPITERCE